MHMTEYYSALIKKGIMLYAPTLVYTEDILLTKISQQKAESSFT